MNTKSYKESKVRFKNNKPFLLKKIFFTLLFSGIFIYFITSLPVVTAIILFIFTAIPIGLKIRKMPAEGKGVFGKIKNFYKNMYRHYVYDTLPLDISVTPKMLTITLFNAEIIKGKVVTEKFKILNEDIAGILYDDLKHEILIMFQRARVNAFSDNKCIRDIFQMDSSFCFSISEDLSILELLTENGYEWERLTEIDDANIETEDPELVGKSDTNDTKEDETVFKKSDETVTNNTSTSKIMNEKISTINTF